MSRVAGRVGGFRDNALLKVIVMAFVVVAMYAACGVKNVETSEADVADVLEPPLDATPPLDAIADVAEKICSPKTRFCVSAFESALCDAEGTGLAFSTLCPEGQGCNEATGFCATKVCDVTVVQCASDQSYHPCAEGGFGWSESVEDCEEGFRCVEDRCVFCPHGLTYCEDVTTVGRCDRDVETYVLEDCPEGLHCQEQTGSCSPVVCIPGAPACLNQTTPMVCLPSGTGWDFSLGSCPAGQVCEGGECLFCPQGLAYCPTSTTLANCDPVTLSYVEEECPEGSLCDEKEGACVASTCEPGITCLDLSAYEGCMEDGVTLYKATCPEDYLCLAGMVEDDCYFCPNGLGYCLSETVGTTCDPENGTYEEVACTGSKHCHEPTGECLPQICEPGESTCDTKKVISTCYPSGTGFAKTLCPEGELCLGSTCVPCPHGEHYCAGPITAGTCDPDVGDYILATCDPGLACNGYLGTCASLSCEEDEVVCLNATDHYTCPGDEKTDWDAVPVESCQDFFQCSFGACVFEPCMVEVVLLIDRSGSMAGSWAKVLEGVQTLTEMEKDVLYGFTFFPNKLGGVSSAPEVPVGQLRNKGELSMVFDEYVPEGGTPLVQAMKAVLDNADAFFSEPEKGYLVVLSDGKAQYQGDAPAALAEITTNLYLQHGIRTYAIGYNYNANPEELVAIAENGATQQSYFIVDGALQLTEALFGIVGDIKLCID